MGEEYVKERELLCVQIGGLCYGIGIEDVAEILQNPVVCGMPWLPEYYLGVCNWNGEILPVAELEQLTARGASGSPEAPGGCGEASEPARDKAHNHVVIVIRDGQYVCGLRTEEPPFILRVSEEDRLDGDGCEAASSACRVRGLYRADARTVALIDVKETLREMAVCE